MTAALTSLRLRSPLLHVGILALAGLVAAADWATGPLVQFPILYTVPLLAAAWFAFPRTAVAIAILLPALRAVVEQQLWPAPPPIAFTVLNAVTYGAVFLALAALTTMAASALRRVAALEEILSLCRMCKRICTDDRRWEALDVYVARHTNTAFSARTCPDCLRRMFGAQLTS